MAHAIMQSELVTPEASVLAKAFRVLPQLTGLDAQNVSKDAFGILMRGLELEDASRLQDALLKLDVGVEVADEADLPTVPAAKVARQIELLPSHLRLYDPMGRAFTLAWSDILLICGGNVRVHEFRKVKSNHEEPQLNASGISHDATNNTRTREEGHFHLLLEIVLTGGVARYCLSADEFDFGYLAARETGSLQANFGLLVQDLAQAAPHAGLNRGAFLICEKAPEIFVYPSKAAFFEEMVWLLWRTASPLAKA